MNLIRYCAVTGAGAPQSGHSYSRQGAPYADFRTCAHHEALADPQRQHPRHGVAGPGHTSHQPGRVAFCLAVGEPDFPTPKHICEAAKAAIDANFCRYTAVPGIPELRAAVGGYFKKFYGEDIAPECTIVSAGGKHALYNFMQASINPGDEVLLPAPYWVSYPYTIQLAGGVPVIVQASLEQGFKVTPEMLDAKCTDKTKLLVLNTPSNPTGAVYNAEELAAILDWADSRDVYVLTDEIYDQLVFAPAKMASAVHHFAKNPEKVAILNGVSKSFAMTGWRVGYVVAHPEIIKKMSSMQGHCTSNICSISQKAALAGLTGPLDFLGEMRNAFQRRRDLAMDIINGWDFASCPSASCPTARSWTAPRDWWRRWRR